MKQVNTNKRIQVNTWMWILLNQNIFNWIQENSCQQNWTYVNKWWMKEQPLAPVMFLVLLLIFISKTKEKYYRWVHLFSTILQIYQRYGLHIVEQFSSTFETLKKI